ncbi:hypothetical protein BKA64DRAFT_709645 [Cadophora sp. MPI-SDFR-AT-0126]|nr:hypothetical protein BKA64DRAFT_709645 [Leotiomycetes sp. MPI-SDFR-AT-0126]
MDTFYNMSPYEVQMGLEKAMEMKEIRRISQNKIREKCLAYQQAQTQYNAFRAAGLDEKKATDLSGLKGATKQYENAQEWLEQIDNIEIADAWPFVYNFPEDKEWEVRSTNELNKKVTSIKDVYDIVGSYVIENKKSRNIQITLPTRSYIEAIIKQKSVEGFRYYDDPAKQNSFKHECERDFSYKAASPFENDCQYDVVESTQLEQLHGTLYKNINMENVEAKKFVYNWHAAEPEIRKIQAPVTPIEEIRILWIAAHLKPKSDKNGRQELNEQSLPKFVHLGRDATYERLIRGLSSEISKDLVNKFIKRCPGCQDRVNASEKAATKANPSRAEKRLAKRNAPDAPEAADRDANQRPKKRQRRMNPGLQEMPREQQAASLSMTNSIDQNQHEQSSTQALSDQYMQQILDQYCQGVPVQDTTNPYLPQEPQEVRPATEDPDLSYDSNDHWKHGGQTIPYVAEPIADIQSREVTMTNNNSTLAQNDNDEQIDSEWISCNESDMDSAVGSLLDHTYFDDILSIQ